MVRYNPEAVQRAIDQSRIKIPVRETKLIHRLLEGRSPLPAPLKTSLPSAGCDYCERRNLLEYTDAKTRRGHWATLCMSCFGLNGLGLGTGLGQYFRWMGTEYQKLKG